MCQLKKESKVSVTKKGDRGYTYLYFGDKLSKDDLRLEVVGTMDEHFSFLVRGPFECLFI
jgi:cob(I)alamin adenosyltransferase